MDDRVNTPQTRRDILAKGLYVAPAILTLAASPAFAQRGSFAPVRSDGKEKKPKDKQKVW